MSSLIAAAALILASSASAPAGPGCDMGQPHPDAPPETSQYAFLIGNHRIEARVWREGAWSKGFKEARWNGRYILGGMAIMDEWFDENPQKNPATGRGVNVRMYNPETRRWHIMWQHTGNRQVVELASQVGEDGKMHLERLTHKLERKVHFEVYGPGHWARLDYRKSGPSGEWEPKFKLEAFRVPCRE